MDEEPEFSDEEALKIFKEALTIRIKEKRAVPTKIQLNKALLSTVGEFLTCFKIIGYDFNGEPVNLTYYKEKIEKSALDNAFMEEISKFMGGRVDR